MLKCVLYLLCLKVAKRERYRCFWAPIELLLGLHSPSVCAGAAAQSREAQPTFFAGLFVTFLNEQISGSFREKKQHQNLNHREERRDTEEDVPQILSPEDLAGRKRRSTHSRSIRSEHKHELSSEIYLDH